MRLNARIFVVAWLVAVASSTLLPAQTSRSSTYGRESTEIEGYLNGQAEHLKAQSMMVSAQAAMIKARFDAMKAYAEAAEAMQKARSAAIDNDIKAVKNYYEKKTLHDAFAATTARAPLTKEQIERYGRPAQVARLASHQIDRDRGRIFWPGVLQADDFAAPRAAIERLFAMRSPGDHSDASTFPLEVAGAIDAINEILRGKVRECPPRDYMAAKRFLQGLAQESRTPMNLESIAKN